MTVVNTLFQALTDLLPHTLMVGKSGQTLVRRAWWNIHQRLPLDDRFRVPVGKFDMWVNTRDSSVSQSLMKYGIWERHETEFLKYILTPGSIFIDCGAHIGYYSLLAATLVGVKGHVYSFEPATSNYDLLIVNVTKNNYSDIVTTYSVALGEAEAESPLFLDGGNSGGHSLDGENVLQAADSLAVPLKRLDAAVGDRAVDVLKCNTQGAEGLVLKGAEALLQRQKPTLMIEWWPWGLRNLGGDAALASYLTGLGYQAAVLRGEASTTRLEPIKWPRLLTRYGATDPKARATLICTTRRSFHELLPTTLIHG